MLTPPSAPIRIAVVGVGSFGRNHLRVYRELEAQQPDKIQLVALVDANTDTRQASSVEYKVPGFSSIAELLTADLQLHAASVCVPTVHHAQVAMQLLAADVDVLIEKPFAASLLEADEVVCLAEARQRIVQIGHLERFNPAVTALSRLIQRPMFFESHRLSIFTPRSLDVDVVLDLMIHDLDIVLALAGSTVREVRAVGLPVLSQKVDIANVRVEFESGTIANFTASRVSTELVRKLRLFQPHQYLSVDFARQDLLRIEVDPALVAVSANAGEATGFSQTLPPGFSAHPSAGLALQQVPVEHGEPLRLEIEDFLRAVQQRTPPRVTAQQGRSALALALEINQCIATHAARAGLS